MIRLEKPSLNLKTSLRRQMTLTLSAVIAGLILLVGLPMIFISVQIQQRETVRERQEIANQVAQTVSGIIQNIKTDQAQNIATDQQRDPRISFIGSQITTGINLITSRVVQTIHQTLQTGDSLETLLKNNPQFQGITILGLDGETKTEYGQTEDISGITQALVFDLARQGINAQDTVFSGSGSNPMLIIATPIMDEQDVTEIVLIWVDVLAIWQSLTDLEVGETGYLYITDTAGQPVMTPAWFAEREVALIPSVVTNQPYIGLNGGRVLGHSAAIENTPWKVVIEIPYAEANASLRSLLIILGAILMFGLSAAISVARLFSRWLLLPIQTLQQSAHQISTGDLAHRITLDRNDELGFLARAFNQMVSTLEETITELRTVTLRLLSAEEAERRRIAYEIHDELGQTLTALKFSLSMANRLSPDNPNIAAAQQMATEAQEKARTLSHELRPAMLDDLGLNPTLEWYVNRFEQRANLAISLETEIDEETLPPELKTTLYRLITEALTNIGRHAGASAVEIKLSQSAHQLHLCVSDDGHGFDTNVLKKTQSLGITAMRERVNLLRGTFLIESEIDHGTKISITLPL